MTLGVWVPIGRKGEMIRSGALAASETFQLEIS